MKTGLKTCILVTLMNDVTYQIPLLKEIVGPYLKFKVYVVLELGVRVRISNKSTKQNSTDLRSK